MRSDEEPPQTYALRITERAQRDLDAATVKMAEDVSPEAAIHWREELYQTLASLASFPLRYPRAPERFQGDVRQLFHRPTGHQAVYRILFIVIGGEASPDAPTVNILHVRHGSARPITRAEARQIERAE